MRIRLGVAAIIVGLALTACGPAGSETAANPVLAGTGDAVAGEPLFADNCAACHGTAARGSGQGPSLISDIYVPSHHADGAFLLAVRNGVQPHHWDFGPMPPRPGLSDQDVADIVAYVRGLQRDAGLIE